jgi:hypothetical protein
MLLLLVALVLTAPWLSQMPNSACYLVTQDAWQARPCLPHETR